MRSESMRAVYVADKTITLVERPIPEPGAGWALVRVRVAGICNTDIELFRGYYGFAGIPGHEFVGEVAQAPDAPHWVGKRVVADINFSCGRCADCRAGRGRHCATRTVLGIKGRDGAFAEYCQVPVENLVAVPDGMDDEDAVFAEPLAAALEVGQQVHLTNRHRLLIIGDGKLGLLAALGLRYLCPNLVLAGRHPDKLAIAAGAGVRVEHVAGPAALEALVAREGRFDVVVEASGKPQTLQQALALVRPEGVIVAKTTSHERSELNLAALVVDEITVVGSRCGDMGLAVSYLAHKWVDVRPLIEAVYPFVQFPEAFDRAQHPGARKVLVTIPG